MVSVMDDLENEVIPLGVADQKLQYPGLFTTTGLQDDVGGPFGSPEYGGAPDDYAGTVGIATNGGTVLIGDLEITVSMPWFGTLTGAETTIVLRTVVPRTDEILCGQQGPEWDWIDDECVWVGS